jgi:hypothetical protein
MKTIETYIEANPELFRQEELILEVTELIASVMVQSGIKAPELSAKLNKPGTFVARHLAGEEELSLRAIADIFGALGCDVRITQIPNVARSQETPQPTWVAAYVERAICDLIPDVGHAREIARSAWKWDDEHPTAPNDIYHWQNEAIRQRRDLIALQERFAR